MRSIISLLLIFQLSIVLGMSPEKTYRFTPDSMGLSYEDLYIRTSDSLNIHAWLITPAPVYDKRTTIIISGSDAGNMSGQVFVAYNLVMQGYTVITYDYRGFGSSDTFDCNKDLLYCNEFAIDLRSVMQYARTRIPVNKLGLFSLSMGTVISAIALQNEQADFLIMDGMIYNPLLTAARLKIQLSKTLYLPDSADQIKDLYYNIQCPMLVFAGEKDNICPVSDSKTLCSMMNNRSLIVYEGSHLEAMAALSKKSIGDVFFKKIFKFLKKQGF